MNGFAPPDLRGALDVEATVARCPPEATTRGMFLADIVEALKQKNLPVPEKRYQAFGTYPQREFITVAADAARALHPDLPPKESLRRLGQMAYPTFAGTMIGKVMFGVLGKDVASVMRVSPKGYAASVSHGRAHLVDHGPRFVRVHLVDVYTYLESYQVGVFEGALIACETQGTVKVKLESPTSGDFLVEW